MILTQNLTNAVSDKQIGLVPGSYDSPDIPSDISRARKDLSSFARIASGNQEIINLSQSLLMLVLKNWVIAMQVSMLCLLV